jgi:hypothetical protein
MVAGAGCQAGGGSFQLVPFIIAPAPAAACGDDLGTTPATVLLAHDVLATPV